MGTLSIDQGTVLTLGRDSSNAMTVDVVDGAITRPGSLDNKAVITVGSGGQLSALNCSKAASPTSIEIIFAAQGDGMKGQDRSVEWRHGIPDFIGSSGINDGIIRLLPVVI